MKDLDAEIEVETETTEDEPQEQKPNGYSPDEAAAFINKSHHWIKSLEKIVDLSSGKPSYMSAHGFKQYFDNRSVVWEEKLKSKNGEVTIKIHKRKMGTWWIESDKRSTYDGIGLYVPPQKVPARFLNLWKGFALQPKEGDCSKIHRHLRLIANDIENDYEYLRNWLFYCLQKPGERPDICICIHGEKGTGKTTVAKLLVKIIGDVGAVIMNDANQFLENDFTKMASERVFIGIDEAGFAGGKKNENKLKGLITADTQIVNEKHVKQREVPNFCSYMIITNSNWAAPTTPGNRRFVTYRIDEVQPIEYFEELYREIDNGGAEAFLHEALEADLSDFVPRIAMKTVCLGNQSAQIARTMEGSIEGAMLEALRDEELEVGHANIFLDPSAESKPTVANIKEYFKENTSAHFRNSDLLEMFRKLGIKKSKSNSKRYWKMPSCEELQKRFSGVYKVDFTTLTYIEEEED